MRHYLLSLATLLSSFFLLCVSSLSLAADASTTEKFEEKLLTSEQFQTLKSGGFVIYMRHSMTDNSRPDRAPSVDLANCDTQRMLSDEGRALAKRVGEKVALANIPMDIPVVSPMCRAKETAMLTYQRAIVEDKGLMYSGSMTSAEKVPVLAKTRQLLSDPVAVGTNRLLVAHAPNLMDIIGYFPKEATLVVFHPQGNGQFVYIGSIPPTHWDSLLEK